MVIILCWTDMELVFDNYLDMHVGLCGKFALLIW